MKLKCTCCEQEKGSEDFYKQTKTKRGYSCYCKECFRIKRRNSFKKDINKTRITSLEWYYKNKEKYKEYYRKNAEAKRNYQREWNKNNRALRCVHDSKRRASKLNATPKWLTKDHVKQIKEIYLLCNKQTISTEVSHHVDHIVPLISDYVCGLHVPWNLRVITAEENIRKNNHFDPWVFEHELPCQIETLDNPTVNQTDSPCH